MAVGRAVSHWAHAEVHLANVFGNLTGMDHTMAATVFRMFRSVPNQKEVLLSVAKVSTRCDESDLATLSAILIEYSSLAVKRNDIAHNPLGWQQGEEQKIYRMKREKVSKPGMFPYSRDMIEVEDIEALTSDIKALVTRIGQFDRDLFEKRIKEMPLPSSLPELFGESPQPRGLLDT
ncbi:hypothetical protein ACD578_11900 [Microvirga sp. RSM25]|uniref:hypothetical protein n=1 Tax=Microvirga sp. RSM25 TaxID=3273802 RepID=UPI003850C82E